MVRPQTLLDSIKHKLEQSGQLPSSMEYLTKEADNTGEDADIKLPICEIDIISSIDITNSNTDRVGYVRDSNGNQIGRRYHAEYELDVAINFWIAAGTFDERKIGHDARAVLYPHDSAGDGQPLKDPNGNVIDDLWRFQIRDGSPENDFTFTPSVRRWRQELSLWAVEEFETTEDYITAVNYPGDGDFSDSDGDGMITG